MNLAEMLEELRKKALADPKLRKRLLETRKEKAPFLLCYHNRKNGKKARERQGYFYARTI